MISTTGRIPAIAERLAQSLPDGVPERRVDTRAGDEPEAAVAENVERRRPGERPAPLGRERILAKQFRGDLTVDDAGDLLEAPVLVADVGLTDDSLARGHANENGRAMRHVVVAALVDTPQRHTDERRLDRLDPGLVQGIHYFLETFPVTIKSCKVTILVSLSVGCQQNLETSPIRRRRMADPSPPTNGHPSR